MISSGRNAFKHRLVYGEQLSKVYKIGGIAVPALRGVTFEIEAGEFLALVGPSGSGKTTLLNMIGCIERPSQGHIAIDGRDTGSMSANQLADMRAQKIGYVFQNFNLLPVLNALENVEYPLVIRGIGVKERRRRAEEALHNVGLEKFARHRPIELSGGQRQRVAIARAVVGLPMLVVADEPTANLDQNTGLAILELMKNLSAELNTTFIIATHDHKVMETARRALQINDGLIMGDSYAGTTASTEACHAKHI